MQIVIDIPEDYYEIIKHDVEHGNDYLPFTLIANSTPLPKGHGDLIDAEELLKTLDVTLKVKGFDNALEVAKRMLEVVDTIEKAPVIIEADKEDKDVTN